MKHFKFVAIFLMLVAALSAYAGSRSTAFSPKHYGWVILTSGSACSEYLLDFPYYIDGCDMYGYGNVCTAAVGRVAYVDQVSCDLFTGNSTYYLRKAY